MVELIEMDRLLLAWWDTGHADLPWRRNRNPYHIWISEIMLQQTQIKTVIPYFERWIAKYPTVEALAEASLDDVLKQWEGLGYYSRARNLHGTARRLVEEYDGKLPNTVGELLKLKGIGRYTAGAIASIAFDEPAPILDGNVIRVLSRLVDLPEDTTLSKTKKQLWGLAETVVPDLRPGDFNQAMMELGQRVCISTKPTCHVCPLANLCLAKARGTQLERPVRPPRKRIPHFDVAAGVIYREDGKFLIAQRPLDGLLGGLWEFPGGKQEAGETLDETLVREIQEELGIVIRPKFHLTQIKHAYTHFRITLHAISAEYVSGKIEHLGVINHAWVTLEQLAPYAFANTDRKIIETLKAPPPAQLSLL
ncbi:MAG: A/G-specific adenine glycosylase [Candidatus Promineifilaceae bacterium]